MTETEYFVVDGAAGGTAGSGDRPSLVRLLFAYAILQVSPPWLRRRVGKAVLSSIGAVVDMRVDRVSEAMRQRFPNSARPAALSLLGEERRIRRGPGEDSVSYAARLRKWWDSHRTRGSSFALLEQLYPYLAAALSVPIELVTNSGNRHKLDAAGAIVRDTILWGGDGTAFWARVWVMLNLTGTTLEIPIISATGEPVLDVGGSPTFTSVSIFALTDAEREFLCAVPREWSAAHVQRSTIVLLHPDSELWGYRTTDDPDSGEAIGTWADDDPSPGQVWQSTDPVQIVC